MFKWGHTFPLLFFFFRSSHFRHLILVGLCYESLLVFEFVAFCGALELHHFLFSSQMVQLSRGSGAQEIMDVLGLVADGE